MSLEIGLPLFQDTATYLKEASVVNVITIVTVIIWTVLWRTKANWLLCILFIKSTRGLRRELCCWRVSDCDQLLALLGCASSMFWGNIDSCICLFNKHLLSGSGTAAVNKTNENSSLMELVFYWDDRRGLLPSGDPAYLQHSAGPK